MRYLVDFIKEDLNKKMVFLGGPRQVGKTTLAQSLIHKYRDEHPAYLNWDSDLDRRRLRERDWPKNEPLIILVVGQLILDIFEELCQLKTDRLLRRKH